MQSISRKFVVSAVSVAALFTVAGCHKKMAPPPPPPPTVTAPTPTAEITVTPNAINAGDSAVLTWKTSSANDVSIEGMGQVATSGTQNVKPTASTSYHLIARGDGGSTDATARVTVNSAPPPSNMNESDMGDTAFHQNVKDIFYDYDSYDVSSDAQATIQQDATFLKAHPQLKVVVGGYCDERGSTEYNLALGENRANAAKQALVNAGVDAGQLRSVSYGKEKQFCTEHDESCWQQNRRAQFSVDR